MKNTARDDARFMAKALRLAEGGYGLTSPNPIVGALLVRGGQVIGRGWHHRAGEAHAEIEALRDARKKGREIAGATLYVTLEPCSTFGRTPPCTKAIIEAGLGRVVIGSIDPNPRHSCRAVGLLERAGIKVTNGILQDECLRLNEAFNHWIVCRRPFVIVKAAMTLDGRIATVTGDSKWITSERSRLYTMTLRQGADAILVGVNTILMDDPRLTLRSQDHKLNQVKKLRRIVLDGFARTPLHAQIVCDANRHQTTIVVSESAPKKRVQTLAKQTRVLVGPTIGSETRVTKSVRSKEHRRIDLPWLLDVLGNEGVTSLLVEGGGEVNASFLTQALTQRVAFFYAPKILGGREAHRAVGGKGATRLEEVLDLAEVEWEKFGPDLFMTARVQRGFPAFTS